MVQSQVWDLVERRRTPPWRGAECGLMMLSKWLEGMVFRVDVAFVKIGVGPCREAYDEPQICPARPVDVGPWLRSSLNACRSLGGGKWINKDILRCCCQCSPAWIVYLRTGDILIFFDHLHNDARSDYNVSSSPCRRLVSPRGPCLERLEPHTMYHFLTHEARVAFPEVEQGFPVTCLAVGCTRRYHIKYLNSSGAYRIVFPVSSDLLSSRYNRLSCRGQLSVAPKAFPLRHASILRVRCST